MNDLTVLSDAELDAVAGGHGFSLRVSDVNVAIVSQVVSQNNVVLGAICVSQSNSASTSQSTVISQSS
jgi:hypothetical protein